MKCTNYKSFLGLLCVAISSFSLAMHEPIELDSFKESLLTVEEQEEYKTEEDEQREELDNSRRRGQQGLNKDQQNIMDRIRNGRGIVWASVKVGSPDFVDSDGNTPLMLAAEHGRSELIDPLLSSAYPSMNKQNNDGNTALMMAAMHGNTDVIGALFVYHTTIDPNIRNNDGFTALDLAIKNGKKKAINFLLEQPKVILSEKSFMAAVSAADVFTLTKLLKKRAEMSREQKDAISRTKLLTQADKIIVASKLQIRDQGLGADALFQKKLKKQEKIAELLISYGVQRTTPNEDDFMAAISDADIKRLKMLFRDRKSMSPEQKGAISRRKLLKWANQLIEETKQRLKKLQTVAETLNKFVVSRSSEALSSPQVDDGSGVWPSSADLENISF